MKTHRLVEMSSSNERGGCLVQMSLVSVAMPKVCDTSKSWPHLNSTKKKRKRAVQFYSCHPTHTKWTSTLPSFTLQRNTERVAPFFLLGYKSSNQFETLCDRKCEIRESNFHMKNSSFFQLSFLWRWCTFDSKIQKLINKNLFLYLKLLRFVKVRSGQDMNDQTVRQKQRKIKKQTKCNRQ